MALRWAAVTTGSSLALILPEHRVSTRAIDRAAFASDASFYTLTPEAVVRPADTRDVKALFAWSRTSRVPLTFRAAGTSLSGQAVTSGVLVHVARDWRTLEVLDGGARVRCGPGVVGGMVNAHLARYGAKLGPDPASIGSCMIGGIVANNSSGMCCGIRHNAYRTLESLRFVLPSGTEIDTSEAGADDAFATAEPGIAAGLMRLRSRILDDPRLVDRIRTKYRMKNTMGYALNALLDFDRPLAILWHLLVGSEGTLAFIAEAVFRTIPDLPLKSTGLLFFPDVPSACKAIEPLTASGAAALELMDRAALRSIQGYPGIPPLVDTLPPRAAAILAEYQASNEADLSRSEREFGAESARLSMTTPPDFTRDPRRQGQLWFARKGLTATIGAMRPPGTSLIFEDVCFPVSELAPAVTDLQALMSDHGYADGIVFGHAKDGNIHFLLSQAFDEEAQVAKYERFTADLVALVVDRYDGALKAEHGTGRNMAPFLRHEWGDDAYAVMAEIKRLIDPDGILNPGVLLNDDPRHHLENLKSLPRIEPEVDRCIECGFCESSCPSKDLTVTPRQRIVLRREQARRAAAGDRDGLLALEDGLRYAVEDTCATDGSCALTCPVGIDTGTLVKRLRSRAHGRIAHASADLVARAFAAVEATVRLGLRLPGLSSEYPAAAAPLPAGAPSTAAAAVYFPSCLTRAFGGDRRGAPAPALASTILEVCRRAGVLLFVPENAHGTCCGLPFSSKGFESAHAIAANRAIERAWQWSDGGRLTIVVDNSACAYALNAAHPALSVENRTRFESLRIHDAVRFAHETVLPRLTVRRKLTSVTAHPVCSAVKAGLTPSLRAVLTAVAEDVRIPLHAGCCGFAGDRGFSHPELTAAATRMEAAEIRGAGPSELYVSGSRTCEIGLSRATGRPFVSYWHALEHASRGPLL